MITIHTPETRDFTYSGLATLDASIINPVVAEDLNGAFTFEFDYPADAPNADLLVVENIIATPVPGMTVRQGFRVSEIQAQTASLLHVVCLHVFYDLATNLVADTFIVNKTPQQALTQLLGGAQFPAGFTSQGATSPIATIRIVRMSVAAAILDGGSDNTLMSRLGGDYTRDNFHILHQTRRGADRGVVISDRKNLTGYKSVLDFSTVTTRILPVGFDGLLLPELYVDSPKLGHYQQPHVRVMRFEKVKAAPEDTVPKEDELTLPQAYAELRRLAKLQFSEDHVDEPAASYTVSFADLASTLEYADLQNLETVLLGDTVTVIHAGLGQRLTARVVAYEYNPLTGAYLKVTLGSATPKFTSLASKVSAVSDAAQAAGQLADFALVSASGKNTNYYGPKTPANPQVGDVWFKENGELTEIWIWATTSNGTPSWVSLASDLNYSQVQAELDIAKTEVQTAMDTAKDAGIAAKRASEAIDAAQEDLRETRVVAGRAETQAAAALQASDQVKVYAEGVAGELVEVRTTAEAAQKTADEAEQAARDVATALAVADEEIKAAQDAATTADEKAVAAQTAADQVDAYAKTVATDLAGVKSTAEGARDKADAAQQAASNVTAGLVAANQKITSTQTAVANADKKAVAAQTAADQVDAYAKTVATDLAGVKTTAEAARDKAQAIETEAGLIRENVSANQKAAASAKTRADNAYTLANTANTGVNALKLSVAEEDAKLASQISLLAGDINLRVKEGEIIAQINISPETILIDGKYVHITGNTSIDSAVIKTAMIADAAITNAKIKTLDAAKITTGTLAAARIAAGSITSDKLTIADGFILTAMIKDAAITNAKIASLDAAKITTGYLAASRIKAGAITSEKLTVADGFIATAMIADAAITDAKIGSLDASKITTGFLAAERIEAGAITSDKLTVANGFILSAMIKDAAITNAKISALDAAKITTGYLAAARIKAGAITSDKLTVADGFIATAMIADAAITNAKIGSLDASKVTTGYLAAARIEAGAITSDKLTVADGFVATAMISDLAVTDAKVADLSAAKITTGYLAAARIQAGSITSDKLTIASGFITTAMIKDAAITNAKIGSLDAAKINTGTLAAARIAAGSITSDKLTIAAGFILTAMIKDAAITNAKIANLDAAKITTGTLLAARIAARSITADKLAANAIQVGLAGWTSSIRITPTKISWYNGDSLEGTITSAGMNFYYGTRFIGMMGTSYKEGSTTVRGMVTHLNGEGDFISWAYRTGTSGTYTAMLCMDPKGSFYGQKGLHLTMSLYAHNHNFYTSGNRFVNLQDFTTAAAYASWVGSGNKAAISFSTTHLYLTTNGTYYQMTNVMARITALISRVNSLIAYFNQGWVKSISGSGSNITWSYFSSANLTAIPTTM